MSKQVIVIGGGLAGLAAAAALAERGLRVTLLESRPRLGGRASSFTDAATGETIDNCQHVAMGCCTNFRDFCRRMEIEHLFQDQPRLTFVGPRESRSTWQASRLPAPFHLAKAFLGLKFLTIREKLTAARGLRSLARLRPSQAVGSMSDWLAAQGQPARVVERFWNLVLVSALSESLDRIDLGYARKVFVDGFLANRGGWMVMIPKSPLDAIYGGPIRDWFSRRQAQVRLGASVQQLAVDEGRVVSALLRSGERIVGDEFVVAVPHDRAAALLPAPWPDDPYFRSAATLQTSPISSVHLWFDRAITSVPHAVFVGLTSQWMFRRTELNPDGLAAPATPANLAPGGIYYQIVVSASREFLERPTAEAIEHVRGELQQVWPDAGGAQLLHARVVTEHKAVFSPLPGIDALRPAQQTPLSNLQLAGDWTATGWPATMEGAVKSGHQAADNVLSHLGQPRSFTMPDLPVSRLSRWLLRL